MLVERFSPYHFTNVFSSNAKMFTKSKIQFFRQTQSSVLRNLVYRYRALPEAAIANILFFLLVSHHISYSSTCSKYLLIGPGSSSAESTISSPERPVLKYFVSRSRFSFSRSARRARQDVFRLICGIESSVLEGFSPR